jgi:hypothetical protein
MRSLPNGYTNLQKYKVDENPLLILNRTSSHINANTLRTEHYTCLPSNMTHKLQPLYKAVFKALELYWDDELLLFFGHKSWNKLYYINIWGPFWGNLVTGLYSCKYYGRFPFSGCLPISSHAILDGFLWESSNILKIEFLVNVTFLTMASNTRKVLIK